MAATGNMVAMAATRMMALSSTPSIWSKASVCRRAGVQLIRINIPAEVTPRRLGSPCERGCSRCACGSSGLLLPPATADRQRLYREDALFRCIHFQARCRLRAGGRRPRRPDCPPASDRADGEFRASNRQRLVLGGGAVERQCARRPGCPGSPGERSAPATPAGEDAKETDREKLKRALDRAFSEPDPADLQRPARGGGDVHDGVCAERMRRVMGGHRLPGWSMTKTR